MARSQSSFRYEWLRFPLAILFSLTLLVALVGSVAAAPPTLIRESTTFAGAFSDDCVTEPDGTEVCTFVEVDVFMSGATTEVCLFTSTAVFPPDGDPTFTDESGCTTIQGDDFSINRKLTSAALEPVTMTVFSFVCDEFGNCTETSREVTVSTTWTGVGDLARFHDKSSSQEGHCKFMFMGKGVSRSATAVITLDGQTFEADDAVLVRSRTSLKISAECA